MQHNRSFPYLVTVSSIINVCNYEKCKLDEPFLLLKTSKTPSLLIGKNCLCKNTEMMGDEPFDGNNNLVGSEDNEYVLFSGFKIIKFNIHDKIVYFISLMGDKMVQNKITVGDKHSYFISNHYIFLKKVKLKCVLY